ncbi:hypothetical protein EWI61_08765 [Methylolobus aquaticus]|nr:hypothetical protein EWI61_08765 [Methylolobus aquaticus]
MQKKVIVVCKPGNGVGHRFLLLRRISDFARVYGYEAEFLWGVTGGVAYCRWEELFSPFDNIRITNIAEGENRRLIRALRLQDSIRIGSRLYEVVKQGKKLSKRMVAFNLLGTACLARRGSRRGQSTEPLVAQPSAIIGREVREFSDQHHLFKRLGIRIRVTEGVKQARRPHRVPEELDECLAPLMRLTEEIPVFLVTDSEYIQDALKSHFKSLVYQAKSFDEFENGSRYVNRSDTGAMLTFLRESFCLGKCRRVIRIGGFLNDHVAKLWSPPYIGEFGAMPVAERREIERGPSSRPWE